MKKLILLFYLFTTFLFAQTFELDNSFGDNGSVITDFNNIDNFTVSIVELQDHKILALTYNYSPQSNKLVKYLPSGELDISFGNNGFLDLNFEDSLSIRAMIIQNDQKIILYGKRFLLDEQNFFMIRLLPNGDLDSSFGDNGIVISNEYNSSNNTINFQGDKILVIINESVNEEYQLRIYRYLSNGTIDTSFGENGSITYFLNENPNSLNQIVTYNNHIFVFYRVSFPKTFDFNVIKISSDGFLVDSFGDNGKISFTTDTFSSINFALKNDGKLIFAIPNETSYYLTQYTSDGLLDVDFGTNGIALNNFNFNQGIYGSWTSKIKFTQNSIFIFGNIGFEEGSNFIVTNHLLNGDVNPNFLFEENNSFQSTDYILQNDGEILIAGETFWFSTFETPFQDTVIQRYKNNVLTTDENILSTFNVYPNPTQDFLTIELNQTEIQNRYKILDVLGKTISTGNLNNLKTKIDISTFNKGIYFMKIYNETLKIIKN